MNTLTRQEIEAYAARLPAAIFDEPMSKHTTFRLGGSARLYVIAISSEQLLQAVQMAVEMNLPWSVMGGGTNTLVADQGFEGVVIQAANQRMTIDGDVVVLESGVISALAARKTVEAGLTGFEWAVGLPGTIGGAVYGNAGCFGGEMGEAIVSVDVYDVAARERRSLTQAACQFGYRESIFKHTRCVILGCTLRLLPGQKMEEEKENMRMILETRKETQPLGASSAGCVFKNFVYQDEYALDLLRREIDVPSNMLAMKKIPAGWLIDQAGLKGKTVGGFEVSQRHGNFFLNKGQGKAEDVLTLISLVKMRVRDIFGIQLQEEVQLLGFSSRATVETYDY